MWQCYYLNKEEFGLAHQRGAAVSPEQAGESLHLHRTVCAKKHSFIPMAQ